MNDIKDRTERPVLDTKDVETGYVNRIVRMHEEAGKHLGNALHCAIQAGRELAKAKEEMGHGAFGSWVSEALPFDVRTAQRYMAMYAHADEFDNIEPASLSEAYKLIETPKERTEYVAPDEETEPEEKEPLSSPPPLESDLYEYWPILNRAIAAMNTQYLKLNALRDHTTPIALGYMIGNLKEMADRLEQWDPEYLFDCPKCNGTMQIEDENSGHMTTCSLCVDGKIGPYKLTDM